MRSLIREFEYGQETIEDTIDELLDREVVEIERQRFYGRESVLISIARCFPRANLLGTPPW